ncbi:hypothetical protein CANINC_000782 [Pichia inconspicua]|uniref:Uncharacterized protein n=1 Tax=Pichia inconspicua TaxID=52247 RepID=A0A4T0X6E3_9ASCO|nr:hypothetical protein CANINC_000782 [[Candida] inconspicua]
MHFNIFNKSDNDRESISGKLRPASVKSKFTIIGNNTPSLTDNSFRGEQKRAMILEQQLREVSLTASKAYDKVDELKLRNDMLEDQVQQQKQLIETFTQQLEQSKSEGKNNREIYDMELKRQEEERLTKNNTILELEHEKDMLKKENESLRNEIEKLRKMYNDERTLLMSKNVDDGKKLVENHNIEHNAVDGPQSNYEFIIKSLRQRVAELEESLESKNESYENNILLLKSAMNVLNRNQVILDSEYRQSSNLDLEDQNILDKGDGDTFILENISFLR